MNDPVRSAAEDVVKDWYAQRIAADEQSKHHLEVLEAALAAPSPLDEACRLLESVSKYCEKNQIIPARLEDIINTFLRDHGKKGGDR